MRALDLYCGLGAYTRAMLDAGVVVVSAAECDEWRRYGYAEHFGYWPAVDVSDCIAANPGMDLWTACVGVKTLEKLVTEAPHLPRWLWAESVREPFKALVKACSERFANVTTWDACGRRFLVAGPTMFVPDIPAEHAQGKLQHPDRDTRQGLTLEEQEAALGLPEGWTAVAGATDRLRRGAIASSSHLGHLRHVARHLVDADRSAHLQTPLAASL